MGNSPPCISRSRPNSGTQLRTCPNSALVELPKTDPRSRTETRQPQNSEPAHAMAAGTRRSLQHWDPRFGGTTSSRFSRRVLNPRWAVEKTKPRADGHPRHRRASKTHQQPYHRWLPRLDGATTPSMVCTSPTGTSRVRLRNQIPYFAGDVSRDLCRYLALASCSKATVDHCRQLVQLQRVIEKQQRITAR